MAAPLAIGNRGAGRELDDTVNDELWSLLAERNVFVFLHPSGVPDAHRLRDVYLVQLVGDQWRLCWHMVLGGIQERFELTMGLPVAADVRRRCGDDLILAGRASRWPGRRRCHPAN